MKAIEAKNRIIVALDVSTLNAASPLVIALAPYVGGFKVGLELITSVGGPRIIECIHSHGGHVFYDGKFNDIPNTVASAARAIAQEKVWMFNVHASSGVPAMRTAVNFAGESKVLAVTVLTSLSDEHHEVENIFGAPSAEKVLQFAYDAMLAGCQGIICSPNELQLLAEHGLDCLLKVTPGVRPEWAGKDDQKRFAALKKNEATNRIRKRIKRIFAIKPKIT